MSGIAENAVLVRSAPVDFARETEVQGPSDYHASLDSILASYGSIGFQATNFAKATDLMREMLRDRVPADQKDKPQTEGKVKDPSHCTIFLGATANLFATGVRESIRFLCEHNLVDHIVVSGGAMEHDIRRAVEEYRLSQYSSDRRDGACEKEREPVAECRVGNIAYPSSSIAYHTLMQNILWEMVDEQEQERLRSASAPMPDPYFDTCTWSWGPSRVWREFGLRLGKHLGSEDAARETVLYWAAQNNIPIFSPSFSDGDIAEDILEFTAAEGGGMGNLKLDLVQDIHKLNRSAMEAKKTGMIILGGGVVKHHICNANLMRNGADLSVFINNAQEYDGSDAGARPDEAVSWGKIKLDAPSVKVYSEISLIFPLLLATTCVEHVRSQEALKNAT